MQDGAGELPPGLRDAAAGEVVADRPPGICRVCGKIAPDGRHCADHQSDNLDLRNAADRQRRRRAGVLGGLLRLYDTAAGATISSVNASAVPRIEKGACA